MTRYRGKTIDFAKYSENYRTTIAHFLNHGKWNDKKLSEFLKSQVIKVIYDEAKRSGKPIFCIEVYFRNYKTKLAFDKFQIRSAQSVRRFWLITSLAYYICCMNTGKFMTFDESYHNLQCQIQRQYIPFIYTCGAKHLPLDDLLSFTA